MSVNQLDGRPIARKITQALREEFSELIKQKLAIALVHGNDPSALAYARSIARTFTTLSIAVVSKSVDEQCSLDTFIQCIEQLNHDPAITAVLILQPLPAHLPRTLPSQILVPSKDVDGITPFHQGQLALGEPTIIPSTPLGALALLRSYDIPLRGRHAVVVGRSTTVGRPLSLLLLTQDATVTVCHRQTSHLLQITQQADVLLVAAGVPKLITPEHVRDGTVVVDFGIHPQGRHVVGDVDPAVAQRAAALTPVPGGTGPLTTVALAYNFFRLAAWQRTGSLPKHDRLAWFVP